MDRPIYYIELIEQRVWGFNSYWDITPEKSELRTNPLEAVTKLESYATILKNSSKRLSSTYKNNPDDIKMIVNSIIEICNDGRDLRVPQKGQRDKDMVHINEDGELNIEHMVTKGNINYYDLLRLCSELRESIESEDSTKDFNRFIGKMMRFDGCEDGSHIVLFSQISKNKDGEMMFSGIDIFYSTSNNLGDGIVINDVEDMSFEELPYNPLDDCDEDEVESVLLEWLNDKETIDTFDELYNDMLKVLKSTIQYSSIPHFIKKHDIK